LFDCFCCVCRSLPLLVAVVAANQTLSENSKRDSKIE